MPTEHPVHAAEDIRATRDPLTAVRPLIEDNLAARIHGAELPANLREAIAYSALGPGKRLRPGLVLMCCQAVGGQPRQALPAAAAIELIHCFSLVHDDLPAMDDDDMRRGRPTLHVHVGEAMAILAGDAMVSLAFQSLEDCSLSDGQRLRLVTELAGATTAMIAGQVLDTLGGFARNVDDRGKLDTIHQKKTGALIRAACRMGAICGNATAAQIEALTRYGDSIGLMFQAVDDLLDVTQATHHVGKATGKDSSAGKLTYPGLLGIEQTRREIAQLQSCAHEALNTLGEAAGPLADVCDSMAVRTK